MGPSGTSQILVCFVIYQRHRDPYVVTDPPTGGHWRGRLSFPLLFATVEADDSQAPSKLAKLRCEPRFVLFPHPRAGVVSTSKVFDPWPTTSVRFDICGKLGLYH